jgi:PAS domain S-box-containing protein
MPEPVDRYRRTLDSLIEGFQIVGFDWTYLYVNPSAAAQGRKRPDELAGRRMWDAYPGFRESPTFTVLETCMTERVSRRLENLFTYPDGDRRWFELRVEPVPEGLCIHSIDIHDRKSAEEALQRSHDDLEARVAARTRDLEAAIRDLDAFCYSVSHDLRAPLRHVAGYAEVLREHAGPSLDEEGQRYLSSISNAAARMSRLIDGLLQLSRYTRAPLEKRRLSLSSLVTDVRREVEQDADGRTIAWEIGPLPDVDADQALFRVVLTNLLSNAVKYTRGRPDARIEISGRDDTGAGESVLVVRDNGVGFEMQHAGKLFGVFQRLHPPDQFEGTGIGLANVHRVVSRHGGRVWAEAEVDRGAAFYVALPLLPGPAGANA